jgi:hypothetical protein
VAGSFYETAAGGGGGGETPIGNNSYVSVRVNPVTTSNNSMGSTKWSGGTPSVLGGDASWWDGVAYEITPPVAGWYQVKVTAQFVSGTVANRRAVGYATDATEIPPSAGAGGHKRGIDVGGQYVTQNVGLVYLDGVQAVWPTWAAVGVDTLDMSIEVIGPLGMAGG